MKKKSGAGAGAAKKFAGSPALIKAIIKKHKKGQAKDLVLMNELKKSLSPPPGRVEGTKISNLD